MSLIAWYPLKNDIKDYSLNGNDLINSDEAHVVLDQTNGKLGKSYNFDGSSGYLYSSNKVSYTQVTFASWVYLQDGGTSQAIGIINNMYDEDLRYNISFYRSSAGALCIAIPEKSIIGHSPISSGVNSIDNKWMHFAASIDTITGETKLYVDGNLVKEMKISSSYLPINIKEKELMIGGKWNWNANSSVLYNGKLNDVRVYDNILTQKQIREIYKTCILNYTFDNPYGEATQNMIAITSIRWSVSKKNYNSYYYILNKTSKYWKDWMTIGCKYKLNPDKIDTLTDGYQIANYAISGSIPFDIDKKYTLSFYLKILSDYDLSIALGSLSAVNIDGIDTRYSPVTTASPEDYREWKRFIFTFNPMVTASASLIRLLITCNEQDAEFLVADPQLELYKDHTTPFVVGSRLNEIYDLSGYGNNGLSALYYSPKWIEDNEIGIGSYLFNGIDTDIECAWGQNVNPSTYPFSVSLWVYPKTANKIFLSASILPIADDRFYVGIYDDGTWSMGIQSATWTGSSVNAIYNRWHHIVVIFDGTNANLYVDGELVRSIAYTSYVFSSNIHLGKHVDSQYEWDGKIHDIKIYATNLIIEDIKNLYQSKYTFDVNSDFYCNAIEEKDMSSKVDNIMEFNNNGLLEAQAIDELYIYGCGYKKLDDGSEWARIFYHYNKDGSILFTNSDEALYNNSADKFSRLSLLEKFRDVDGKFEFLLEYPNDMLGYNRWKQTSNPAIVTTPNNGVVGYEAVSISWNYNNWGGLEYSGINTFIDGSVSNIDWHYAIGSYNKWHNSIPGPTTNIRENRAIDVSYVELWVRIDTLNINSNIFKFSKDYIFMDTSLNER